MAYIIGVVIGIENTCPTIISDVREVIVEDDKKDGSKETSLWNPLFTNIFWITKF